MLMDQALALSGFKTKKETVEEALRLLISLKSQAKIKTFRGKMNREGITRPC
ncbi:MAG: type II toxin-antitoxin system VapB family antitoxin [Spirochaetales bacterium]|nr:type II toxin-antitoxin system VapB family antitoxin [Spirochaetales bacterium]